MNLLDAMMLVRGWCLRARNLTPSLAPSEMPRRTGRDTAPGGRDLRKVLN